MLSKSQFQIHVSGLTTSDNHPCPQSPTFPVFLTWFIIPKFQYQSIKEAYAIKRLKSYCSCKNQGWGFLGVFCFFWSRLPSQIAKGRSRALLKGFIFLLPMPSIFFPREEMNSIHGVKCGLETSERRFQGFLQFKSRLKL